MRRELTSAAGSQHRRRRHVGCTAQGLRPAKPGHYFGGEFAAESYARGSSRTRLFASCHQSQGLRIVSAGTPPLITRLSRAVPAGLLAELRSVTPEQAVPPYWASELLSALRAHPEFEAAVHPAALSAPSMVAYRAGGRAGSERAGAFAAGVGKLRVDVCLLLWLSERAAYEGGEVVIDEGGAVTRWMGEPGDVIAFPAGARRSVEPVSRGELLLCSLDVQSLVAGESERRILLDFHRALQGFEARAESVRHAETMRRLCNELIRMWAVLPRTSGP